MSFAHNIVEEITYLGVCLVYREHGSQTQHGQSLQLGSFPCSDPAQSRNFPDKLSKMLSVVSLSRNDSRLELILRKMTFLVKRMVVKLNNE